MLLTAFLTLSARLCCLSIAMDRFARFPTHDNSSEIGNHTVIGISCEAFLVYQDQFIDFTKNLHS